MDVRKNILILTFSFIFLSLFFWAKTGNMLIDFSREVYIPFQMLNGQKLTKDIFLIYGPFGYILNFILYSIKPNINFLLLEAQPKVQHLQEDKKASFDTVSVPFP